MTRTLVVGDPHGCAVELGRLLEALAPDRLLLTGDLFTKGPDPVGVWDLIRSLPTEAALGNHDQWLLDHWRDPGRLGPAAHLGPAAREWLAARPLFLEEPGFLLVHAGVDPTRGPRGSHPDVLLTVRRWPLDAGEGAPRWWELWRGGLVVYGHDARLGLMDRRAQGTLGLDSGCVYGGELTGWLVEEDQLYQTPADRAYKDVGRRRTPTSPGAVYSLGGR